MATGKQKGHKKLQKPKDPLQQRQKFWPMLISLGATGATTGPFLDGIHSRVGLIVYDKMPITLGQLHTSLWMPPLLMAFYVVLGSMFCFLDYRMAMMGDTATREALQHSSLTQLALSFGALAAGLAVSSLLYERHTSVGEMSIILMAISAASFLVFDGTKQGLALATFCALAAPLCELVLMGTMHLFHYTEPNVFLDVNGGMPSWVLWCYFFYTPAIANLSRYLMRVFR